MLMISEALCGAPSMASTLRPTALLSCGRPPLSPVPSFWGVSRAHLSQASSADTSLEGQSMSFLRCPQFLKGKGSDSLLPMRTVARGPQILPNDSPRHSTLKYYNAEIHHNEYNTTHGDLDVEIKCSQLPFAASSTAFLRRLRSGPYATCAAPTP